MTNYLTEKLTTKVCGEYDVIVAGGGIAGVAAALAASHHRTRNYWHNS